MDDCSIYEHLINHLRTFNDSAKGTTTNTGQPVGIHSQVQIVRQGSLTYAYHDQRYLLGFFLVSSSFSWWMSTLLG